MVPGMTQMETPTKDHKFVPMDNMMVGLSTENKYFNAENTWILSFIYKYILDLNSSI